ncbi:GNAT family N-acetyltransferase [Qipengyuania nanhaisediminis]|uniref:GNAT family N-acetyltransferase n=1 Tax=Qipengyuania nanhaisediminis TaxID=604088 RepID=UPI0038B3F36F
MADTPVLETARLRLRPLASGDEHALFPTLSDPEQCLYLSRPAFESAEELRGWLADPKWNGRTWIAEDNEGTVVARFVAVPTDDPQAEEVGYITCAERQRQGIAREGMVALIAQLFAENKRRIIAEVDPRNTASVSLLESLGFAREAHLRDHEVTHIGTCDLYIYALDAPGLPVSA